MKLTDIIKLINNAKHLTVIERNILIRQITLGVMIRNDLKIYGI